jgi:hypothetical protein
VMLKQGLQLWDSGVSIKICNEGGFILDHPIKSGDDDVEREGSPAKQKGQGQGAQALGNIKSIGNRAIPISNQR